MKFNLERAISIIIFIIVLCVIVGVTILILSQFSPTSMCQSLCNWHHGIYNIVSDCDGNNTMACAGFCNYDNKSVSCNDLLNEINSSE